MTQKVIWPGLSSLSPSSRLTILQRGGKILETCTRFDFSMPAFLRANSKAASLARWIPTPLVKNILFGTMDVRLVTKFFNYSNNWVEIVVFLGIKFRKTRLF